MPGIDDLMNVEADIDEYGEPIPVEERETENNDTPPVVKSDDYTALDEDDDSVEDIEFDNEEEETDENPTDEVDEQDDSADEEGDKKVQTPEENAFYAEKRRQQQALEKQQELDRLAQERLKQSPEYQVAQMLAAQYGLTPEQMQQQLQQVQLQKEAEKQGVPVEFLKQREEDLNRIRQMEEKLKRTEFENWYGKQQQEASRLQEQYKGVITEAEINESLSFMLNDLKTTNIPLEQVVRMKHGAKIEQHLINMAKQEALAEISGRKPSPLAPQGVKSAQADVLTPEERHVAQMMGISEKDYLKYKK